MDVLGDWNPAGRITRLQWWRFQIWAMFGLIAVIFVSINIAHDVLRVGFVGLAAAAFLLTLIIVAVKRLHDRDKSAWWLAIFYGVPLLLDSAAYAVGANLALIFVAPAALINLWALIEFGLLRGSLGPNRFGDDPTGIALPPPLPAG